MTRPYRILHTADWHLGASFHEQERASDEAAALQHLVHLCATEDVDAVIIAGDIFDTQNPSADAQRRYYRALLDLVDVGGVGCVLVISGNHDSGGRLDAPRELLAAQRIIVFGSLPRVASPDACLAILVRRDGSPGALVMAIPYLREQDLDIRLNEQDLTRRQAQAMQDRFALINTAGRTRAATLALPLVATAHCFARSGLPGGAERPVVSEAVSDIIGHLGQVDAASLAEGVSYLALGHLHRPQAVSGRAHWRYSGGLLPTGFDEIGTRRVACLAIIPPDGGPATIVERPLPQTRRYADLIGTPDQLAAAIRALEPPQEDEPAGLLRAVVELAAPWPTIAHEITEWALARGWRALLVERRSTGVIEVGGSGACDNIEVAISELDPEQVLRQAWEAQHPGTPPTDELLVAFRQLVLQASDDGVN